MVWSWHLDRESKRIKGRLAVRPRDYDQDLDKMNSTARVSDVWFGDKVSDL